MRLKKLIPVLTHNMILWNYLSAAPKRIIFLLEKFNKAVEPIEEKLSLSAEKLHNWSLRFDEKIACPKCNEPTPSFKVEYGGAFDCECFKDFRYDEFGELILVGDNVEYKVPRPWRR